jgi:hypothetical protein
MPLICDRILELFYAKPTPVHEQRIACFTKLKELQERIQQVESQTYKPDTNTVFTAYQKEYERCEPIMRMK